MRRSEARLLRAHLEAMIRELDLMEPEPDASAAPKGPAGPDLRAPEVQDEYFTAAEAQDFLRTKPSTFYEWIRKGRLPKGRRFGPKSPRWKRSDLEKAARTQ